MNPKCISCGMPLRSAADHAGGDPTRLHCVKCSDPKGNLKPYAEVLAGMTEFLVRTQGMDRLVCERIAAGMMSDMPAWKDHGRGGS